MEKIEDRFIRYVKIDTESDEKSTSYPSSKKQLVLANMLLEELKRLGVDAYVDEYGLVYGKIDGDNSLPKIGLIAHMDTSPALRGGNFEPRIITNYDGKDIQLNNVYTLSQKQFPSLSKLIGKSLIVTDGDHLLGGDDKAGIAIIMAIVEYYSKNNIRHAPIRICFTPDEEIGAGADHFSVEKMDADIAYTLDGGPSTEINYENFNASGATISIQGVSIHPGDAKGKMVNAITLAMEFNSLLDPSAVPEKTERYEGFYHLCDINGDVDRCEMSYIIRDHDENKLKEKEQDIIRAGEFIKNKYPTANIIVEIKEQYRNMRYFFDKDDFAIKKILNAYHLAGLEPKISPIRGGTDGARITYMGLPCPNIGTGDRCCHGRYEHVVIEEMYEVFEVVKQLLENN